MSPPKKPPNNLESQSLPLEDGIKKERLNPSAPQEDNDDSQSRSMKTKQRNPLFAMQESLLIPKEMTLNDKLTFCVKHTQEQNWSKKLDRDSILGGESSSPYWSEFTKGMSDALSALTPTDSLDLASPSLSGSVVKQNVNSWFSMKEISLQNKNSLKISCPSSTVSLLGYTDSESTENKSNKRYKKKPRNQTQKSTPNAVWKIRVYPSKDLHRVWKRWLAAYRWVYNWTIEKLKKEGYISAYTLQPLARKANRPDWVKELPGHQLQEAVSDAVDAFAWAKANGSQAKFKSVKAPSQVIKFKAGNYKQGCWYPKKTKGLTFYSPESFPNECLYATQLVYQKGKWYGIFPESREESCTKTDSVIALDPGVRTFLTGYDGDRVLEVGERDIGRVNRLCTHLDDLLSRIAKCNSKRKRFKMRKATTRIRHRIQNLVKDLHNKVAKFLVSYYKVIFLPTFDTSEMVLKSKRKINSKTARNMMTLSHYKFAEHLLQMAKRNGVLVVRCNESFTSKTCPECGHIHDRLGGSKKFKCPNCGYTAHRDWNGARNIMLRALAATPFTLTSNAIPSLSLLNHK